LALPPEFVPVFDGKSWSIPVYLKRRGIKARTAAFYGIGYCATGRYGGRIILPAHVGGELAFYQARSVTGASPKYLAPIYDRSSALWGYDEAIGSDHVLVVEGPFDVLGATQAGFAAVAIMGKTISLRQVSLIRSLGASRITVLLDPEAYRESTEVARRLGEMVPGVLVGKLPDGCDPGDAPPEVIQGAVADAKTPGLRERLAPHASAK
jgi:DNA primase